MLKEEVLLREACETCLKNTVKSGDKMLVAVSGGVDSMVMLDLLLEMREMYEMTIEVAHIHHHLREASDAEWEFVKKYCAMRDVPFHGCHIDVRAAQKESGDSMEATAHRLRHDALREMMSSCGAVWICLAHHADDRAETVLMNLLRGSSVKGLAAMGAHNGVLLRPLLGVTRKEIETYAVAKGIAWVVDESNNDTTILRNKLRHELIPDLKDYNPNIVQALNHLADNSEITADYIEQQAQALYRRAIVFEARSWRLFQRAPLKEAHEAVLSAWLRQVVEKQCLERHSLRFEMVKQALARIQVGKGRYDLGGGMIIEATRQWIYIGLVPSGEWRQVEGTVVHDFLEARLSLGSNPTFDVRFPQSGDSICLENLGHKRLKKIFQEKGLPSCLRKIWPLIYDIKTKEVIWVPFLARTALLMYYNSVTFSEVDLTITIAGCTERLGFEAGK